MNRSQALKEAARRFGKTAAVEDKGPKRASNPESREAASAERREFRATIPQDRRPTKEERDRLGDLLWKSGMYRYTVGHISTVGPFRAFHVEGQGDTWEDAFSKVNRIYDKAA